MKQRWLPGFDGPEAEELPLPGSDEAAEPVGPDAVAVPVLPGQFALFTVERELVGLLESAVLDGRFEEARELRDTLLAREGPSRTTIDLSVLDEIGTTAFWARDAEAAIDDWWELERDWLPRSGVRAQVWEGILRRATASRGPVALVFSRPTLLAPVVDFLGREAADAEPPPAAALLRDALAAGLSAPSGEFDDDRFVDLLAEDRSPCWLACLGALNRLWPVPRLPADAAEPELPPLPPEDDEEGRGRQFWLCLRMAVSRARDSVTAVEARKRMKLLDQDLHARFMRQGVSCE